MVIYSFVFYLCIMNLIILRNIKCAATKGVKKRKDRDNLPCNIPCSKIIFYLLQLQLSLEEVQPRVAEMEQELSSLQRERDEAQRTALLLQNSLDQLTQVRTLVA